jgi:hypothetical protein
MPLDRTVTRNFDGSTSTQVDWVPPEGVNDPFVNAMSDARRATHDYAVTTKSAEAEGIVPPTPSEFFDQNQPGYVNRASGTAPPFANMEEAVRFYRDQAVATPDVKTFKDANEITAHVTGDLASDVERTRQSMLGRGYNPRLPLPGDTAAEYGDRIMKHEVVDHLDPTLPLDERAQLADEIIAQGDQEQLVASILADLDVENTEANHERGLENYFGMIGMPIDSPEATWICNQASQLMSDEVPIAVALDMAYASWVNPGSDAEIVEPPDPNDWSWMEDED